MSFLDRGCDSKVQGRKSAVLRAREKREERKVQRERESSKLLISLCVQKWYRGRRDRLNLISTRRPQLDRRMTDVVNIKKRLAAQGVPFSFPIPLLLSSLADLLLVITSARSEDDDSDHLLEKFCTVALVPSLEQNNSLLMRTLGSIPYLSLRRSRLLEACMSWCRRWPNRAFYETAPIPSPVEAILLLCGSKNLDSGILNSVNPDEERDVLQQEEQCIDELLLKNAFTWIRKVSFSLPDLPPETSGGSRIGGIWRLCLELLKRRPHVGHEFVAQILSVPSIVRCLNLRTHWNLEAEQLLAGSINTFGNFKEKFHLLPSSSSIEGCPSTTMLAANISALCSNTMDRVNSQPLNSTMKLPHCPMLSDALYLLSDIFSNKEAVPESILGDRQASCLVIGSNANFQTAVPIPINVQKDLKGLLCRGRIRRIVGLQLFGLGQAVRALHQVTAEEEQITREVQRISAATMALESVQREKACRRNWRREGGLSFKISKYLSDTMAKLLVLNRPDRSAASKETVLDNTSKNAIAAARGLNDPSVLLIDNDTENMVSAEEGPVDDEAVWALVGFLGRILWRWSVTVKPTEDVPSCVSDLKNTVCFSTDIISRLWAFYISTTTTTTHRNNKCDINNQHIRDR
eukprot:121918_1